MSARDCCLAIKPSDILRLRIQLDNLEFIVNNSRHTCPILSIYGHCGKSESCKSCKRR